MGNIREIFYERIYTGLHRKRKGKDHGRFGPGHKGRRCGVESIYCTVHQNVAVTCGLFSVEDLLKIIDKKPDDVEIVITGRNARPEIIERADLVTEMKEIKHYYQKGVKARVGIEK